MHMLEAIERDADQRLAETAELAALRTFVREVANQDPSQPTGQRESNKGRAEDLVEQWRIE